MGAYLITFIKLEHGDVQSGEVRQMHVDTRGGGATYSLGDSVVYDRRALAQLSASHEVYVGKADGLGTWDAGSRVKRQPARPDYVMSFGEDDLPNAELHAIPQLP